MALPLEDFAPETLSAEVVHWMAPGRTRVEAGGLAVLAAMAVALGMALALAAARRSR